MAAVGAVLLAILQVLGILLAVLLGVLLLLVLVPASVWVDYAGEVLTVKVGILFFRFRLLPKKEKKPLTERQRQAAEKKQRKKAAKAAAKAQNAAPKTQQETAKLTAEQICAAIKGAGRFLRAVLSHLHITQICICLPVTGQDAADTAIRYGKTQAWLHGILGVLNQAMWLDFDECRLEPDFTGKMDECTHCSCKISAQLIIIGIAAGKLFLLLKEEKVLDAIL
ncbi:MAG: DUF2953 domain-containing protein [Faecalibacterium sp.]|jgi:hypothetical protein|nr:DUF2953 domain-containing protein [Faecalibacterium sp.]